jgi:glyoxylase-like metal-dependent hydrolase (beta-lactamase superfamily II)
MLVRIKGAISNCYLLLGEKPVLVGTGAPGDLKAILETFKAQRIEIKQLALILLTHGHSDQAGCAAELRRRSGAQIAIQAADAPLVRSGRNGMIVVQDWLGRVLRPLVDEEFEAFEPDLAFEQGIALEPYGLRARVLPTPGHTAGSVSVVLANGEALIGDVLRGSLVWPNKAREHYFCNDPARNQRSIVALAREGLLRCHPGTFGSFPGSELGRFLSTGGGEVLELSRETA